MRSGRITLIRIAAAHIHPSILITAVLFGSHSEAGFSIDVTTVRHRSECHGPIQNMDKKVEESYFVHRASGPSHLTSFVVVFGVVR